ncbi:MAG: zf-HC2 domain-containing protein [Clostridia bacterium]|nr:zf-HC2 domain-containing protein [Clostridia bacterium]MBQ1554220.1 zf-HC2 domain-containing protein [Clostridia bacterium]MBQ4397764.1 zf-HC2 domain-containing protein [Clostridia bacterium]
MSRINCDTAGDLIPLYVDKVLTESSVELVDEHLAECKTCRQKVKLLQDGTVIKARDSYRPLRKIKQKIRRYKLAGVIAVTVLIVLFGVYVLLNHMKIVMTAYAYDEVKDNLRLVSVSDISAFHGGMKSMLIYDGSNKKFHANSLVTVVGQKDGKTQVEVTTFMERSAYDDIDMFYHMNHQINSELDDIVFMDEYVSWTEDLFDESGKERYNNVHRAGGWDNYERIAIENMEVVRLYYGRWETYTASENDRWHAGLTGERHLLWAKAGYENE